MKTLALFSAIFFCSACGVKAPPVAIQRQPETKALNLNCSVYDPTCDKKDPQYDPKKDPQRNAPQGDE